MDAREERLQARRANLVKIRQWANGEYAESLDQQIQIIDRQLAYIQTHQENQK